MPKGKANITAGFLAMAGFMVVGFVLIYLRDFAPGKEEWIREYADGDHFEMRIAHAHGNLFALLNIVIGYLLLRLPVGPTTGRSVSWLALAGLLMPLAIISEGLIGAAHVPLVLVGALSMLASVVWMAVAVVRIRTGALA